MLTNMFYELPDEPVDCALSTSVFLFDQVDLIGGIEFIFLEVQIFFFSHIFPVKFDRVN